jgi:hypothetical protein
MRRLCEPSWVLGKLSDCSVIVVEIFTTGYGCYCHVQPGDNITMTPLIIRFGAMAALALDVSDPVVHFGAFLSQDGASLALLVIGGSVVVQQVSDLTTDAFRHLPLIWQRPVPSQRGQVLPHSQKFVPGSST